MQEKDAIIRQGELIKERIQEIYSILVKAETVSVAGGLFSSGMTADYMDKAQKKTSELKPELESFERMIAGVDGVELDCDAKEVFKMGNGLFTYRMVSDTAAHIAVIERIRNGQANLRVIKKQIELVIEKLS